MIGKAIWGQVYAGHIHLRRIAIPCVISKCVYSFSKRITCGIVGHWLYVLMASLRFGLYTSSSTFTCSIQAL